MFKRWLLPSSVLLAMMACAMTQEVAYSQQAPRKQTVYTTQAGELDRAFAWTNEQWTSTDQPFLQIQREVDGLITRKQLTFVVVQKLKASALKQPMSSRAQFRWVYAMMKAPGGINLGRDELFEAESALGKAASPRSARYARLRFILAMWQRPNVRLIGVGERLLARYPKDHTIKYNLAQILGAGNLAQQDKALSYAQQLVASRPKDAANYSVLADIYLMRGNARRSLEDFNQAIAVYKKFLQLAPPNDPSREGTKKMIEILERDKAKRVAGG